MVGPVAKIFADVFVGNAKGLIGFFRRTGRDVTDFASKAETLRDTLRKIFPLGHGSGAIGGAKKNFEVAAKAKFSVARKSASVIEFGIHLKILRRGKG